MTISNFNDLLTSFSIPKDDKTAVITHTRIGDKDLNIYGAKYTIPPTDWEIFMKRYFQSVFVQGKKEYLTEKQLVEDGPILIDIDFRYKTDVKEKQHNENYIIDIVMLYAEKISELVAVRDNVNIDIFVLEKSLVNILEDKTKDGIHIIFGIKMHKGLQIVLRDLILKEINNIWHDLPLTNSWEDVFDLGVTKGQVNWQMYGSRKPGNLAYMIKYHYIISYKESKREWSLETKPLASFSTEKNMEKLSARYTNHPEFTIKDHVKADFERAKDNLHKKESAILTPPSTPSPCENINDEQIEILDNINNKYWSEYSTWRDLVWAIKNTFSESSFEIAKKYSQKTNTNNYDEDALINKLEECNDTKISWGTIAFYSKESNLKSYEKIISKYKKIKDDELKKIGKEMLMKSLQIQNKDDQLTYEEVKKEFEKTHAKIVNKTLYICKTDDDVIMFLESKLITSFRHIKYYEPEMNNKGVFIGMKENSFIKRWIEDGKIRRYDDIGLYPPPLECPNNIFNLWQPFWISKLTDEYEKDEEGLDMFKNHTKILCNHDENVNDYIIKWFAQMFQYPATKTIVPTFISEEGTGKGSVLELMGRMMGNKKTLVTTQPSRDVWGSFNSLMSDCFFVNLNEMSKKETLDSEGKIKGLITDPQLTINPKGISPYLIFSCHRFIITTQNEEPVKTKNDDRRNLIIRSSDEKAKKNEENGKYFEKLREKLENVNTMRTIYDYFMSIEGLDKFISIPIPKTEWQNDMKDSNRSPFCRWVESYIREIQDENEDPKLLGEEQYRLFKIWTNANGITHETSSVKMAIAIKRLNINGIETGIKGMKGNFTKYNIEKLKKHYLIGCQI
jgi:hypothetical protein